MDYQRNFRTDADHWKTMAEWGTEVGAQISGFLLDVKRQGDMEPNMFHDPAQLQARGELLLHLGHGLRVQAERERESNQRAKVTQVPR